MVAKLLSVLAFAAAAGGHPARPHIVWTPIPFGDTRKQEMRAYAQRHYGIDSYKLTDPKVIVEHVTVTSTFSAAFNTFAPDVPDVELHELPGLCAHFVIDRDGTIHQLVPLGLMCRHTVGLNWTAIGIEHVGMSDADVMDNPARAARVAAPDGVAELPLRHLRQERDRPCRVAVEPVPPRARRAAEDADPRRHAALDDGRLPQAIAEFSLGHHSILLTGPPAVWMLAPCG